MMIEIDGILINLQNVLYVRSGGNRNQTKIVYINGQEELVNATYKIVKMAIMKRVGIY